MSPPKKVSLQTMLRPRIEWSRMLVPYLYSHFKLQRASLSLLPAMCLDGWMDGGWMEDGGWESSFVGVPPFHADKPNNINTVVEYGPVSSILEVIRV